MIFSCEDIQEILCMYFVLKRLLTKQVFIIIDGIVCRGLRVSVLLNTLLPISVYELLMFLTSLHLE